jgi:adenine phosphoribosyltransferase
MSDIIYGGINAIAKDHADYIVSKLRLINDFPRPGINFRDIMGVLADADAFRYLIDAFAANAPEGVDLVAGTDSRGFLLAAPLALRLGVGFVPLRKSGKLPPPFLTETYEYEYSSGSLEIKPEDIQAGQKVLVVDDLIATGGTILASKKLIERSGGDILKFLFFIELSGLDGVELIHGKPYTSLITLPA